MIATYPKCGTTWMQRIVSLLVFLDPAPIRLMDVSPWLDCRFVEPVEATLGRLEAAQHRRFIKSHLPADGLPFYDELRYLVVARDGRDACLSYHNHVLSYTPWMLARLDAAGLEDGTGPYPRAPTGGGLLSPLADPRDTVRARRQRDAGAAPSAQWRFFGGIRSVIVPSNISAAKLTVSDSVGCGWIVCPMSVASAPISIASATSAIRSPAFGPTMPGADHPVVGLVEQHLGDALVAPEATATAPRPPRGTPPCRP